MKSTSYEEPLILRFVEEPTEVTLPEYEYNEELKLNIVKNRKEYSPLVTALSTHTTTMTGQCTKSTTFGSGERERNTTDTDSDSD